MSKVKKIFACNSCGATFSKWSGQCADCKEWNSIHEELLIKESPKESLKNSWSDKQKNPTPLAIQEIQSGSTLRKETFDKELNRVLGGGIVDGSLILIGGEPGIGKSTLMLQIALRIKEKVLYVSGEESEEQIKMRSDRIESGKHDCFVLADTNLSNILHHAKQLQPSILIIDSIQTLQSPLIDSAPGTVSQVRECAAEIQRFSKENNIACFIIGHITKDGNIAGPKVLEHIVDVVLQFEGDSNYTHRILRTIKNRFGSTADLGIYEMNANGLREINNPSELLISPKNENLSGCTIAATLEGIRPMLIETQALVSHSIYSTAQRSATSFDLRRLGMFLAVLEKRCGFQFIGNDVFLNIAGGIKVSDPAIDLAIIAALISSLEDHPIPQNFCFAGEIGLSGEIRTIQRVENRILEANRLGFEKIFIPKQNMKGLDLSKLDIEVIGLGKIELLYKALF